MDCPQGCSVAYIAKILQKLIQGPQTVYKMIQIRCIFNTLIVDADTEWIITNSNMFRAHQQAAATVEKIHNGTQWYTMVLWELSRRF